MSTRTSTRRSLRWGKYFSQPPTVYTNIFAVHGRGAAAGDFLPAEEVHDLQPQARDDPEGGHGRAEGRAGGSSYRYKVGVESATLLIVQGRKDELIRKHYEKLGKWKEMLADAQVAPQHPSTARASRSHIIQPYISPCLHHLIFSVQCWPRRPRGSSCRSRRPDSSRQLRARQHLPSHGGNPGVRYSVQWLELATNIREVFTGEGPLSQCKPN